MCGPIPPDPGQAFLQWQHPFVVVAAIGATSP